MSVGEQLGLDDPNDGLRVQARQRWGLWAERYPQLGAFAGPESLREWLRDADPDARDEALSALGALGSRDAGDDCAAAGTLLWLLLPGASLLACRLRGFSPIIDELVAAQLWVGAWSGRSGASRARTPDSVSARNASTLSPSTEPPATARS